MNVNNINSGSTNLQEIYIFREEEILKVIIHELIHYSKYDLQNSKYLNDLMLKKIKYLDNKAYLNINESYTESIAIILYIFYLTIRKNNKFDINFFKNSLDIELKWSLLQLSKILCYSYNFTNLNEIYNNNNIYQVTDIFSYYIIKTALLYDYDCYFNFLNKHTNNLNFIESKDNYISYYNFIIKALNNKNFNNIVNNIIKKFLNSNILIKSMRMSYLS